MRKWIPNKMPARRNEATGETQTNDAYLILCCTPVPQTFPFAFAYKRTRMAFCRRLWPEQDFMWRHEKDFKAIPRSFDGGNETHVPYCGYEN